MRFEEEDDFDDDNYPRDDGYLDDADDDGGREFVLACGVPDCVIPGYHIRNECVTAQQMADYHRQGELDVIRNLPTEALRARSRDLAEELGVALVELVERGTNP